MVLMPVLQFIRTISINFSRKKSVRPQPASIIVIIKIIMIIIIIMIIRHKNEWMVKILRTSSLDFSLHIRSL